MSRKLGVNVRKGASHQDVRPPNPPWVALLPKTGSKAALSFYYSDPLSKTPIRDALRADPNIETMTFGLFSRCDRGMRATIVRHGIDLHFFCTTRRGPHGHIRVLTGYYRYGWYFEAPLAKRKPTNNTLDDYMLAAKELKFVSPGFPLADLTAYLHNCRLDKPFRTFKYVDGETATRILSLLDDTTDSTKEYISEIGRVEQLLKQKERPFHKDRLVGFSWDIATKVMVPEREEK
jgi:hypothetical protein